MMDLDSVGVIGLFCVLVVFVIVQLVAFVYVAGYIASLLGVSGFLWWCVAFVVFLLLNGVVGAIWNVGRSK